MALERAPEDVAARRELRRLAIRVPGEQRRGSSRAPSRSPRRARARSCGSSPPLRSSRTAPGRPRRRAGELERRTPRRSRPRCASVTGARTRWPVPEARLPGRGRRPGPAPAGPRDARARAARGAGSGARSAREARARAPSGRGAAAALAAVRACPAAASAEARHGQRRGRQGQRATQRPHAATSADPGERVGAGDDRSRVHAQPLLEERAVDRRGSPRSRAGCRGCRAPRGPGTPRPSRPTRAGPSRARAPRRRGRCRSRSPAARRPNSLHTCTSTRSARPRASRSRWKASRLALAACDAVGEVAAPGSRACRSCRPPRARPRAAAGPPSIIAASARSLVASSSVRDRSTGELKPSWNGRELLAQAARGGHRPARVAEPGVAGGAARRGRRTRPASSSATGSHTPGAVEVVVVRLATRWPPARCCAASDGLQVRSRASVPGAGCRPPRAGRGSARASPSGRTGWSRRPPSSGGS